jgi:hypothetical protein
MTTQDKPTHDDAKDQQPEPKLERLNYVSAGMTRKYPKGHRKYEGE